MKLARNGTLKINIIFHANSTEFLFPANIDFIKYQAANSFRIYVITRIIFFQFTSSFLVTVTYKFASTQCCFLLTELIIIKLFSFFFDRLLFQNRYLRFPVITEYKSVVRIKKVYDTESLNLHTLLHMLRNSSMI